MNVQSRNVGCIFVLFNPEQKIVARLHSFAKAGYLVVAVVNACQDNILNRINTSDNLIIVINDKNYGLAKALNQGALLAFSKEDIDYIALFDQDSEPTVELPLELLSELKSSSCQSIACIGPTLLDIKSPSSKVTTSIKKSCRYIPTSGSLIPKTAFQLVGGMFDDLFIDSIDQEWCFRANDKGLKIIKSSHAIMLHNMGDDAINFFGIYKPLHRSPIRHYYITRNSVYLLFLSHVPLNWKLFEIFKIPRRTLSYMVISDDRLTSLRYIFRGVLDGLRSKLGPLS